MKNLEISMPRPHVLLVRLNRPHALNALSRDLVRELGEVLTSAAQDGEVRCVVLTGDERAVSAGADIKEMPEGSIPMWAQSDRLRGWKIIERFSKLMIAAVNGYALGGGARNPYPTGLCEPSSGLSSKQTAGGGCPP